MQHLKALFRDGPAWLGAWEGRSDHDVCAAATGTASDVWIRNSAECAGLIEARFNSWVIGARTMVGAGAAYVAFSLLRAWLGRPQSHTTVICTEAQDLEVFLHEHSRKFLQS